MPTDSKSLDCERHGCAKSRRQVELCNMGARGESLGVPYWQAWEEGRGPGQAPPEEKAPEPPPQSKATQTPARARARKLACKECPDGNWIEEAGVCQVFSPEKRCLMRSYFNGRRNICTHWPE
jgi:hypothetical protein